MKGCIFIFSTLKKRLACQQAGIEGDFQINSYRNNTLFKNFDQLLDAPDSIQQMRKLILQLAVQGKLVPQDPTDEPASELLKKIKAEKEKLIKEGKIKKEKPLPPIKPEEIPYKLPKGWEWVRLGEIGESQTGTTPSTKHPEYFGGDIPFIKPADISKKGINYENETLTEAGLRQGRLIKANSLIMVCIGGSTGKAYFTERDCSCNQQINAITPLKNISGKFMFYFTTAPYFQSKVWEHSTGSATNIINKLKWASILIPLPPLAEQKRIVAKVDQLMKLCDELEENQNKASKNLIALNDTALDRLMTARDEKDFSNQWTFVRNNFDRLYDVPENVIKLRQAILQLAVQGKLVPQDANDEPASELLKKIKAEKEKLIKAGKIKKEKPLPPIKPEEIPYKLPKGWEWVRLGEVLTFEYGKGLKKEERIESGKFPVFGSNGIVGYYNHCLTDKPAIIIGRKGSAGALNLSYDPSWTTDVAYYCVPPEDMNIEYTLIALKSSKLEEIGKGIKPGINRNEAYNIKLPISPLKEQKRIVAKVDQLMKLCDGLESKLQQSQKDSKMLMQTVLQEAV